MGFCGLFRPTARWLFVLFVSTLLGSEVLAALPGELPPLPADPARWINSDPLNYEAIRGKGIVFWYYEENCPRCAAKWLELLELARQAKEKPVLFVAVNSGNTPQAVSAYLYKHRIDWPVIVDVDRSFEQASGVNPISLQNVYQARVVTPAGKFSYGNWNDWPKTLEMATAGATWRVDYDQLHPSMHFAMRRMEFGLYRPVSLAIRTGLKDRSREIRQAAEQVEEQVHKMMQEDLQEATADAGDDLWLQFLAYESVAQRYAPLELPKTVTNEIKKLRKSPAVVKELKAAKGIEAAQRLLTSELPKHRLRAENTLKKVMSTHPDTHAATRAKELLASLSEQPAE